MRFGARARVVGGTALAPVQVQVQVQVHQNAATARQTARRDYERDMLAVSGLRA
jgi:hypothetical protein